MPTQNAIMPTKLKCKTWFIRELAVAQLVTVTKVRPNALRPYANN